VKKESKKFLPHMVSKSSSLTKFEKVFVETWFNLRYYSAWLEEFILNNDAKTKFLFNEILK